MNEIEKIREDFKDHAKSDADFQRDSLERDRNMDKKLDDIIKKLDPILDAWKAVLLSKGFIVGLGSVIFAIGAVGVGLMWLINHLISKP